MLLDESLYTVEGVALVISSQESFPRCHPVLSLLTVTVKQLQRTQQELVIQEYGLDKLRLWNMYKSIR